jgi:vacuolar iron transporter family protein
MATEKSETHFTGRIGWLHAAVLGANDGIVSTASLVSGAAAAHSTRRCSWGAMSMAAGEYVSVHSPADTEKKRKRSSKTKN